MKTVKIQIPLLVLLACLLGGCGGLTATQRDATLKFASAATAFGDATSTQLVKMRDETIQMNQTIYKIPDSPVNPKTNKKPTSTASSYIDIGEYKNITGSFNSEWYGVFLSGPVTMKAFGIALTSMMTADNTVQVKQASDNLAAALRSIPNSPLGNVSAAAISGLSQQLTEWVLEDMKAHAVREVVKNANTAIDVICSKVTEDFQVTPSQKNLPWRYKQVAETLSVESEQSLRSYKDDYQKRSIGLDGYLQAKANLDDVNDVFPKIVNASKKCTDANAALVKALDNQTYTVQDIEEFFSQTKTVYQTVKMLNSAP